MWSIICLAAVVQAEYVNVAWEQFSNASTPTCSASGAACYTSSYLVDVNCTAVHRSSDDISYVSISPITFGVQVTVFSDENCSVSVEDVAYNTDGVCHLHVPTGTRYDATLSADPLYPDASTHHPRTTSCGTGSPAKLNGGWLAFSLIVFFIGGSVLAFYLYRKHVYLPQYTTEAYAPFMSEEQTLE